LTYSFIKMIDVRTTIDLCCPACSGAIDWDCPAGGCPSCGYAVVKRNDHLFDFGGSDPAGFSTVMSWPDGFIDRARPWLSSLQSGSPLTAEARSELEGAGLADRDARLTPLGAKVNYQLLEEEWQLAGDPVRTLLAGRAALGPESRVLDVGCGAGQTLRLLAPGRSALRVGLDNDLDVLALGCRLAAADGQEISFFRASGDRLPFRDGQFTHVICRVALNYMHQARVLHEMARVLRPGGMICGRIEGVGYDLALLGRARSARLFAARLRDLAVGVAHEVSGVQPEPGRRAVGGRAFATVRRVAKTLRRARCDVVHAESVAGGPRCLGFPTQAVFLAERRP
jgi:SAM-dependent methyltransferase